ncbi:alpha/beta-hydrolase, partial [Thozetella sp. PMI_491]
MLSFLRSPQPPRTNNAGNNPIVYEKGRSSVTFRGPGSDYIMTHRIPPSTKEHGVSIVAPPHHYHIYQDEFFHVQSGVGHFFRGFDKEPFAVLSGDPGATSSASVLAGNFHRFENATQSEDLVVDIHLTPESYENEQRFFRNFFGYLDDCRTAGVAPSLFQLLVFLESADTPVAIPMPFNWLALLASRWFTTLGAYWVLGWHKRRVPYVTGATYLQTLDIWVPLAQDGSTLTPSADTIPPTQPMPWIIYIHGGAWRDPKVDSSSFEQTAIRLLNSLANGEANIAGMASINYRLSSHPMHPTDPSPPRDAAVPTDEARTARHPQHIYDVLASLSYLQELGAAKNYILAGHSCGATLAFQVAMNSSRWALNQRVELTKPNVLVGLNGLYDLPAFLAEPDDSHKALVPVYHAFTSGAFGEDKAAWTAVCPTVVQDWAAEWPEGGRFVLVQSRADSLVPYSQLEIMRKSLEASTPSTWTVDELAADGDHNELWKTGGRLCEILLEIAQGW